MFPKPPLPTRFGLQNSAEGAMDVTESGESGARILSALSISKKLEDDVHSLGLKIKHYESSISFLKRQKTLADDTILDMQVTLGNHLAAARVKENENDSDDYNEEAVVEQILKSPNSAAALVCQLRMQDPPPALIKDVVGVVATLATLEDDSLSRVLSEYLGMETMLAIVCKTHACVRDLESYVKEGLVDTPLEGRFVAICLDKVRPYVGDFVANDPQKRLDLLKPRLPNGETPPGFLGFAVNLINIEHDNLYFVTPHGHGLRETLFFNLFSRLQVYKTREDMLQALPLLVDGAVSLDGGILKSGDTFYLGRAEAGLRFPKCSKRSTLPEDYFHIEKAMKEEKWRRERLVEDMHREQGVLDQVKFNYEIKKQEYVKALAQMASPSFAASQNGV